MFVCRSDYHAGRYSAKVVRSVILLLQIKLCFDKDITIHWYILIVFGFQEDLK